MQTLEQSLHQM